LSEDKIYILLILGIFYIIYFPGTHPTQTAREREEEEEEQTDDFHSM